MNRADDDHEGENDLIRIKILKRDLSKETEEIETDTWRGESKVP